MKEKKKRTGVIMGLIVGGAIGSVLSVLFAPDKGEKTRKKVSKQGKEIYKKGKTLAEEFIEKYKKKVNDEIK